MPQGSKSSYSSKQKRQAGHIEAGYRRKGVSKKESEERAWRTVNKRTGGAKGGTKSKSSSRSRASSARKSSGSRSRTTARKATRSRSRARARA